MAGAGILLVSASISPRLPKLIHSSFSVPANLLISNFHLLHWTLNVKPRSSVSHAKVRVSDSGGQVSDELEEIFFGGNDLMEDESDDDDDKESSMDLLIRFLQSMFNKFSKRAKKASRSVLPSAIPPQLVSFAVDGVFLLASLSFLKALLEVACTLGGTVFVAILLLRGIWAAISYFQSSGSGFNNGGSSFGTT